jgi:formate dehydrogenase major subunit
VQWPCNDSAPLGTPIMHIDGFTRGRGLFTATPYVPTDERSTRRFPLLLTTGRILSQYNVGAQTRRTSNVRWHERDLLEIHPHDAEERGIRDDDEVTVASRVGATTLRATISDRVPQGVVYTTFHHPVSGANVVTTEHSDWATNCPEYKVTAVQVSPGRSAATAEVEHPEHRLAALVRMANQIARQLAAEAPDHDSAVSAVATHLDKFWEHDMRVDLLHALEAGTVTVHPVVESVLLAGRVG